MNRGPDSRLGVLLAVALLGVALALGLVVGSLLGPWVAGGYAVLTVTGLLFAGAKGRRLLAPAPAPAGRSCTCCTTSQHDPVKVL